MRSYLNGFLILLLLVLTGLPAVSAGVKYVAAGTYVDSTGTQHPWKIDENHNLAWDGHAYIPFGFVFVPTSLSPDAAADSFEQDTRVLQSMLSRNVSDIILRPPVPITGVNSAALQKLLDYIESCGIDYGLDLADGPIPSLRGYVVQPSIYRLEGPSDETTIVRNWPGVESALFIVLNRQDLRVEEQGGALVSEGKVTIKLANPLGPGRILMVYPRMNFTGESAYSDPWSGYPEYRDRLIAYFKTIKLGKGLRFLINPINIRIDYTDNMNNFVPDSSGYRIGFESYLITKHINEHTLNLAWSVGRGGPTEEKVTLSNLTGKPSLDSLETAARVVPLWGSGRGASYLYDKASGKLFSADSATSQIWSDIAVYRDSSTQEFLNSISNLIKTNVANVPVILTCSTYHTNYINSFHMSGYDGLAARTYGLGEQGAIGAGPIYSLSEESQRTQWFVAVTAPQPKADFADQNSLTASLDSYRSLGAKGFFLETAGSDESVGSQAQWLSEFKLKFKTDDLASYKPEVISYPLNPMVGGYVTRLSPSVWWLPSPRTGKTNYVGDGLSAYAFLGENRTYVWSLSGTRQITAKIGASENPGVVFPAKTKLTRKKNTYSFEVDETPAVIANSKFEMFFPYETAQNEIDRLTKLIDVASAQKIETHAAKESVKTAKNVLKNEQAAVAFGMAHNALQLLSANLGSDIWMEGERSDANSFTGVRSMKGASGGLVLSLSDTQEPPLSPYTASFSFTTRTDSSFELWLAATPPGEGSKMVYYLDGGAKIPVEAVDQSTVVLAPNLAWYKVGVINTFAGNHTISFQSVDRRESDKHYLFNIDAVVLSPKGFTPNGLQRP